MRNQGFIRPILIIFSVLLIMFLVAMALMFLRRSGIGRSIIPIKQQTTPTFTPLPVNKPQEPLTIISTNPGNQETNISAGEIELVINTSKEVLTSNDISLGFNPKIPFYFKFSNSFPSKEIRAKIYGGLQPGTKYTVTIKSASGLDIYTWSFTTTSTPAESSSALVRESEKQLNDKFFPLFDFTPYYSTNFDVGYNDKLNLNVRIKNSDITKTKQEVNDWIKSHGVDPSTHTINYINSF